MHKSLQISIWAFTCCLFALLKLQADPWGKDAELAFKRPQLSETGNGSKTLLVSIGEKMIRFHQEIISPADGPRSHYIPSSSQYTLDAMHKYGFLKGYILGCDRLMRENNDPWVYQKIMNSAEQSMKWNPVPDNL